MAYLNRYKPEFSAETHLDTPLEEYDFNFCLTGAPIEPLRAEGHYVELRPFVPSLYAQALFDETKDQPQLFNCFSRVDPWKSTAEVCHWVENAQRRNPGFLLYSVFNLKKPAPADKNPEHWPGDFSGVMGYAFSSQDNLLAEIGFVVMFPKAQRTHILTHSVSLMLSKGFRLPSEGGYGLRRMCWQAVPANAASMRAARRLGFRDEGVTRAQLVTTASKRDAEANNWSGREGDGAAGGSRDCWTASIVYEEWVRGGVKEQIQALVDKIY